MPVAVAAFILAVAGGNLRNAVASVVGSVGWSVVVLSVARKITRRRRAGEKYRATKVTPHLRRMIPFTERTFWLLILVGGVAGLVKLLVSDAPLYLVLEGVWFIIVGGGHFLFVSLVSNE